MTQDTTRPQREKLARPAKMRRCRFISHVHASRNGKSYKPGDTYVSKDAYPSKEVADQKAIDAMREIRTRTGCDTATYLGAFPE